MDCCDGDTKKIIGEILESIDNFDSIMDRHSQIVQATVLEFLAMCAADIPQSLRDKACHRSIKMVFKYL
jgi:hypothetical protein